MAENPLELVREPGRFIIRDRDAGYVRELAPHEVSRLAWEAACLTHGEIICRGATPSDRMSGNSAPIAAIASAT